jgi:Centromere DNA-binding protein complex CBF3 subunit, domain 2
MWLIVVFHCSNTSFVFFAPFFEGKTNHGIHLFGRFMRALDMLECPVSHLAMYLFWRFENSQEFNPPPDMTANESWFEWRFLTTGKFENRMEGVKAQSYSDAICRIHKQKGWPTNHTGHIGRALGAKKLERLECRSVSFVVVLFLVVVFFGPKLTLLALLLFLWYVCYRMVSASLETGIQALRSQRTRLSYP